MTAKDPVLRRVPGGHAAESVLRETTSPQKLLEAHHQGHLCVARKDAVAVGFADVVSSIEAAPRTDPARRRSDPTQPRTTSPGGSNAARETPECRGRCRARPADRAERR